MPSIPKITGKNTPLRRLLLTVGAFLLPFAAGLSSSSEADEYLFARSAQQFDRLWSGVLGCADSHDSFTVRNRFDDAGSLGDTSGGAVPTGGAADYSECGRRALRNTSSHMLAEAVEGALRDSGSALFDEGFRLDSSVDWIWGKNVQGELDAVLPLWSSGGTDETRRALFLQPGAAFWPGPEGQDRADVNLGLVYRADLAADLVGGASLFYDYNLERGHDRIGGGLDVRHDVLYAGLNYYHPFDEWLEGRTDYEEQSLQGADIRFGLTMDWARFGGSFGAWRFEGDEDVKTQWRRSLGLEAGFRIVSGVSLEAGYERRDEEDSLGSRWNAGLAFRFDLPGLKGTSHDNSGYGRPDIWQAVEREKRILYEERLGLPLVRLSAAHSLRAEGQATIIRLEMSEALDEDVVLHLVTHEASTATLGADFSFGYKVFAPEEESPPPGDATDCPASPCEIAIPAGVTMAEISVLIHDDSMDNDREPSERIDMRVDVPEAHASLVRSRDTVRVTIGAHGNMVTFAGTESEMEEFITGTRQPGTASIVVNVHLPAPSPITLDVLASGSAEAGEDYNFSPSTLTIPAGRESGTITLTSINDEEGEGNETVVLSLSASTGTSLPTGWTLGATTHTVTINDDDRAVGFSMGMAVVDEPEGAAGSPVPLSVRLTQQPAEQVTVRVERVMDLNVVPGIPPEAGGTTLGADINFPQDMVFTFAAGTTVLEQAITGIRVSPDDDREHDEYAVLRIRDDASFRSGENDFALSPGYFVLRVPANDNSIGFAGQSSTATEGGANAAVSIDINLPMPSETNASIAVGATYLGGATADDIIISGRGYNTSTGILSLPAGSATLSVEARDDSDNDDGESVRLDLSGLVGASGWSIAGTTQHTVALADNDSGPPAARNTIGFADSSLSVAEGDTSTTIDIELKDSTGAALSSIGESIPLAVTVDGNEGSDVSIGNTTETIATRAAITNGRLVFIAAGFVRNDPDAEPEDTITLNIAPGAGFPTANWEIDSSADSIDIIIAPSDNIFAFSSPADANIDEGNSTTLALNFNNALTAQATLRVDVSGEGISGSDFAITANKGAIFVEDADGGGTLTIPGGRESPITLTIAAESDATPEAGETLVLALNGTHAATSLPDGWSIGTSDNSREININAQGNIVGFALTNSMSMHENGTHDVVVNASPPAPTDINLAIGVDVDGTSAVRGSHGDFIIGREVTIGADQPAGTIIIQIAPDMEHEPNETITLNIDGTLPDGWDFGTTTHRVTITDDDPALITGTFAFAENQDGDTTEGETVTLTVMASEPTDVQVPIAWSITNGEDVDGIDTGTVMIESGRSSVDIPLVITEDLEAEPPEIVTVTLSDDANGTDSWTPSGNLTHDITIGASDNSFTFASLDNADIDEGKGTTLALSFDNNLTAQTALRIDVTGEGISGSDFAITADKGAAFDEDADGGGTLTIPGGASSPVTLAIAAESDSAPEPDETLALTLNGTHASTSLPDGWSIGASDNSRNIAIRANDNIFAFATPADADILENESTTLVLNFDSDLATQAILRIDVSGSGISGSDFTITADRNATFEEDADGGVLTIPGGTASPVTLVIAADDDSAPELDETLALMLNEMHAATSLSSGWSVSASDNSRSITIKASDNSIGFAPDSPTDIPEDGGRATITLDINNSIPSGETVTVELDFTGAIENTDFAIINGTATYLAGRLTLPTGQGEAEFTIEAIGNDIVAPNKELELSLSGIAGAPDGWGMLDGQASSHTIVITNDEKNTVGIDLEGGSRRIAVAENVRTASLMLRLSRPDGTPYTDDIPSGFFLFHEATGANDDDFSIRFDNLTTEGIWFASSSSGRRGNVSIYEDANGDGLIPLTIAITDDNMAEETEEFTYTLATPRATQGFPTDIWEIDPNDASFTLAILASDNSIEFAQPSSEEIPEEGGSVAITINISSPIPSGENVTVDLGFEGAVEGTDFAIVDGTAMYSNGKLALPTETTEATFTIEAIENPADKTDKNITFTLSGLAGEPSGWGEVAGQTSHAVTITSGDKNTIGFATNSRTISVAEDVGMASLMLQLSRPDDMPYTGNTPQNLLLDYKLVGANENDFSVQFADTTEGDWSDSGESVEIKANKSHGDGLIELAVAITNDDTAEDAETFKFTLEEPALPSQFPANDWNVDHKGASFTLTILASDNSVEFAQPSSPAISEGGGSTTVAIDISNPIPSGETVTVEIGFEGAVEGTDFTIIDGTATYSEGTLTLPTETRTANFTLEAVDNKTSRVDKDLTLRLSSLAGAPSDWGTVSGQTSHAITIMDDDKNIIGFAETPGTDAIAEDAGMASLTLQLSLPDGTPYTGDIPPNLTLTYEFTGDNEDDYSIQFADSTEGTWLAGSGDNSGDVSILADTNSDGLIPLAITITDDAIPEDAETFRYTITKHASFPENSWDIDSSASSFTLIIGANDNTVGFASNAAGILEESTMMHAIPVKLSAYAPLDIVFDVSMRATGWARTSASDFNPAADATHDARVSFSSSSSDGDEDAPGHQQTANLSVTLTPDRTPENDEHFFVSLTPSSPLPAGFASELVHEFTIPAHDNTITFAADQPETVNESDSITIKLLLDNEAPQNATVNIASDASDASDITFPSQLVITPGQGSEVSFTVAANKDGDAGDETITLTLTGANLPNGWEVPDNTTHEFTIEDSDTETIVFDPANRKDLLEAEGEISLRINLENGTAPRGEIGLSLTSGDTNRVRIPSEFSSFRIPGGSDSFEFMVDILADDNNTDDIVTLTLRKGTDGNGLNFPNDWIFKEDVEELTLDLNIADRGVIGFARAEDALSEPNLTDAEYAVPLELSSAPGQDLTIALEVATSNMDIVNDRNTGDFFVDTLHTIKAADVSGGMADYPLLILPDDEYERDETFTVTLSASQHDLPNEDWYIDPDNNTYTVTIPINDLPSGNTLGFTNTVSTVKEHTGNVEIGVTLSAPAPSGGLPLEISLSKEPAARTSFVDVDSRGIHNLTVDAGETEASFLVSIVDDASEWEDEKVTFTLALGDDFPDSWGTGNAATTIIPATHTLTIDDRDDGVIAFVDPRPLFREPYPSEATVKNGAEDAIVHHFEMSISEIPRQPFNLRFSWEYSHLRPIALIYEVGLPTVKWITPEDAADGRFIVPFAVERDSLLEVTEYLRLIIIRDTLPAGWRVGNQYPVMDYAIVDSNGGQIWLEPDVYDPNASRCLNCPPQGPDFNPSTIEEGTTARVLVSADPVNFQTPIRVELENDSGSVVHPDILFSDFTLYIDANKNSAEFNLTVKEDNETEEDETYTLVLREGPGFRDYQNRRIDPARSRYTFTVPANQGSDSGTIMFSPDNAIHHTEGDGSGTGGVKFLVSLEGGFAPLENIDLLLTTSNRTLAAIADGPAELHPDESKSLTIPGGARSVEFAIHFMDVAGGLDKENVTLTLRKGSDGNGLGFPSGWSFKNNAEELTLDLTVVKDNAPTPSGTVQFASRNSTATEPKAAHNIILEVSTEPLLPFDLSVNISGEGTAAFGPDASDDATASFPVRIADAGFVVFPVEIRDDDIAEEAETLILTIPGTSLPEGFTLGERTRHTVTIPASDNTVTFASSASSTIEGGARTTITIDINNPFPVGTSASILIEPRLNGGASDGDYNILDVAGGSFDEASNILTIEDGVASVTFSVISDDDTLADPDESVTFALAENASSFPPGWELGPQAEHTVIIKDDEITSIGFVGDPDPVREGETASLKVNISADIGGGSTNFAWTVSPAEYVENSTGTATIINRNHTLDIVVKDDNLAELAKEFTVTLSDGDTSDIWKIDRRNDKRTISILPSDNSIVFAAPSPATISENGGTTRMTAAIRHPIPSGEAPTIAITPGGDATSDDYNFSVATGSGSISGNTWTLPTGADSATLIIAAVDNSDDDVSSKTLTLDFADGALPVGWNVSGTASHSIFITDDDDAASTGTVQFAHTESEATENASNVTLSVPVIVAGTPATAFDLVVNVDVSPSATTAMQNEDFTVPATLNISRSGNANLDVAILADDDAELAETIVLEIPSTGNGLPDGFTLGAQTRHTVTIGANGNTIGFAQASSAAISENGGIATLTININNQISNGENTVMINVSGDAQATDYDIAGTRYNASTNILTLPTGEGTATLTVTAVNSPDDIGDKTLTLTLVERSLPNGWSIDANNGIHSIPISDVITGNTLGFTAPRAKIKEQSGNVQIEVALGAPAPEGGLPLTATLKKDGGSRVAFAEDNSSDTHNFTIGAGETMGVFAITVGDDANENADETVTFTLALGQNFPSEWGAGNEAATVAIPEHTLVIDDRDDGIIEFVNPRPSFREPHHNEDTIKNGNDDAIVHHFEMSISEVPRQPFNLGFGWEYSHLRPIALIYEVGLPATKSITPEDAEDGTFLVPFLVERDLEVEETEYLRLVIKENTLPKGWRIGEQNPVMDYAIIDSSGGQIWFAPNDMIVDGVTFNPSTITENETDNIIKVLVQTNSVEIDTPVFVDLEGYILGSLPNSHPDIRPADFTFRVPKHDSNLVKVNTETGEVVLYAEFNLTILADSIREEDETYTLVLREGEQFPDFHGRRIDPTRNTYTFTIPAND